MTPMITVRYKCACLKDEALFDMPTRRDGEDIAAFMDRVGKWLGEDHSMRSPFCMSTKTEFVKIPAPAAGIGAAPELPQETKP